MLFETGFPPGACGREQFIAGLRVLWASAEGDAGIAPMGARLVPQPAAAAALIPRYSLIGDWIQAVRVPLCGHGRSLRVIITQAQKRDTGSVRKDSYHVTPDDCPLTLNVQSSAHFAP